MVNRVLMIVMEIGDLQEHASPWPWRWSGRNINVTEHRHIFVADAGAEFVLEGESFMRNNVIIKSPTPTPSRQCLGEYAMLLKLIQRNNYNLKIQPPAVNPASFAQPKSGTCPRMGESSSELVRSNNSSPSGKASY